MENCLFDFVDYSDKLTKKNVISYIPRFIFELKKKLLKQYLKTCTKNLNENQKENIKKFYIEIDEIYDHD